MLFTATTTYSLPSKDYTELNNGLTIAAPTLELLKERFLQAYASYEGKDYLMKTPLNKEAFLKPDDKGYIDSHYEFEAAYIYGPYCNYCIDIKAYDIDGNKVSLTTRCISEVIKRNR